jgi:hypothetical protein
MVEQHPKFLRVLATGFNEVTDSPVVENFRGAALPIQSII